MNKQDLIEVGAKAGDVPKVKAGDVLDPVFAAISTALATTGGEVRLIGFGTFTTSKRKAGKALKDAMN